MKLFGFVLHLINLSWDLWAALLWGVCRADLLAWWIERCVAATGEEDRWCTGSLCDISLHVTRVGRRKKSEYESSHVAVWFFASQQKKIHSCCPSLHLLEVDKSCIIKNICQIKRLWSEIHPLSISGNDWNPPEVHGGGRRVFWTALAH